MRLPLIHMAAPLLLLGCGATAQAAPALQAFRISATVVSGCAIVTGGGANWGTIDLGTIAGIGAATPSASLISAGVSGLQLDCTPGTTVSITADNGDFAVGGTRQLSRSGSADRIPYQLFANGSPTAWTNQAIALVFPAGTQRRSLPVVAVANATAPRRAGTYADTVRVTVSW